MPNLDWWWGMVAVARLAGGLAPEHGQLHVAPVLAALYPLGGLCCMPSASPRRNSPETARPSPKRITHRARFDESHLQDPPPPQVYEQLINIPLPLP
jgi:hypothetical protein